MQPRPLGHQALGATSPRRRESYFFDYVKDELIQEYGAQTVRGGGLKVYTTIDLKKQQAARAAIADNLGGIGPSSAIVTIDPKNGYIKAMASSADYGQSKFNLAAQGHRQPGSTFKVMALMTALRKGVEPGLARSYVSQAAEVQRPRVGPDRRPDLRRHSYGGSISLTRATLKSDNTVYEQLALDLGPDEVKKTARDDGHHARTSTAIRPRRSAASTLGVSPLEMADAYATIANGGYRIRPTAITQDRRSPTATSEGRSCRRASASSASRRSRTASPPRRRRSSRRTSRRGTGTRAQIGCPAAGKTGTTDNFTDAWFVGFTPRLATAVWVGYPTARDRDERTLYHGGPVGRRHVPGARSGATT